MRAYQPLCRHRSTPGAKRGEAMKARESVAIVVLGTLSTWLRLSVVVGVTFTSAIAFAILTAAIAAGDAVGTGTFIQTPSGKPNLDTYQATFNPGTSVVFGVSVDLSAANPFTFTRCNGCQPSTVLPPADGPGCSGCDAFCNGCPPSDSRTRSAMVGHQPTNSSASQRHRPRVKRLPQQT